MLDTQEFLSQDKFTPSTRTSYTFFLQRFEEWLSEEGLEIASLDKSDFKAFIHAQGTWNHNSRYGAYCAVRSYLRWAHGDQCPALDYHLRRGRTPPQRSLDADQLQMLLASIDQSKPQGIRNVALVSLMTDTGLRAAEVCSLQLKYLFPKLRLCRVLVKGGRWEEAVYSVNTAEYLNTWINALEKILQRMGAQDPKTVFFSILGHTPGKPLTPHGLRDVFKILAKHAGIGEFSPHDLRRTFTTLALQAGASTRLVQVAGRWNSIALVERYSPKISARDMEPYFPMAYIDR